MKLEFDYSKYKKDPSWSDECFSEPEYWGVHRVGEELIIDVQRYKETFEDFGASGFIPSYFNENSDMYFKPHKKDRYDYKVNLFRDLINEFKDDWLQEYKPIFKLIRTPSEVSIRRNPLRESYQIA